MQKRQPSVLKQANRCLPSDLTSRFISDLDEILSQDESEEAFYLRKFWLTKYCELDSESGLVRRAAAIEKWLSVEERNQLTNSRIRDPEFERTPFLGFELGSFLDRAAMVVVDVIGSSPSLDVSYANYSGGASTSKRRTQGHPALKFLGKADSTRDAWNLFQEIGRGTQYLRYIYSSGLEPRLVAGSSLFTVPKNADIDRVACKEPDINVYLQKMFGSQIRYLLNRKGINLNDQSINGELARRGSMDGSLATLDLSAASDSVTTELVRRLLPTDWFWYLDKVRSKVIDIDGKAHNLSMFSSMGNGFTFELESLLFYALARSLAYHLGMRGRISVYGDDIICPSAIAPQLGELLQHVGFTLNQDKSFWEGEFRESCGAYWHAGRDVKPFFLKGPLIRLTDLIKTLNALALWSSRNIGIVDPRYEELHWRYATDFIPEELWGGQDLTSITSLVTGHKPRRELREVVKVRKMSHDGGYLHWLQITSLRLKESSVQSSGSQNTGIYRIKANPQQRGDIPIFLRRYDE